MSSDAIDYQRFVEEALLDAVRRLMADVVERGLPGEHYFYLAFRTAHPGVVMPRSLRDLYPDEMTVILQHQFWNLEVSPDSFSVELSFGTSRQRLSIPFAALTTFADPSAQFALRFEPRQAPSGSSRLRSSAEGAASQATSPSWQAPDTAEPSRAQQPSSPHPRDTAGRRAGPGEVIRFDPTRRK